MIELLAGKPPYYGMPHTTAVFQIIENDTPPYPPNISDDLREFLNCCFRKEPSQRSSIKQLLQHKWIQSNQKPTRPADGTNEFARQESALQLSPVELVQAIDSILSHQTDNPINPLTVSVDQLREEVSRLQAEKQQLLELVSAIQHTVKSLIPVNSEDKAKPSSLTNRIGVLEESYISVQSDMKLAKVIYGNRLPISLFPNGIRGVLLMKRSKLISQFSKPSP